MKQLRSLRLMDWARILYIAGVVAALLVFAPSQWFPLMAAKVALAAVLWCAAAVLWALAWWRGQDGEPHPLPPAAWLFMLLPLSYLLSFAFAADRAVGLVGTAVDPDSVAFVALCALGGMLGAALMRHLNAAGQLVRAVVWSLAAAVLFQVAVLATGLLSDRSVNLIGKWNDFGLMLVVLGALLLIDLQLGALARKHRPWASALGALVLVLLAFVNFDLAWSLLLAAAAVIGFASWASTRRLPLMSAATAAVALAMLFVGPSVNLRLSSVVPVQSLEVRPAVSSTLDVVAASHGSSATNALVGIGPNTFGLMWLAHKPSAVNQSQFWNLDFSVGYSTLLTAFGTVGLVGLIAWLLPGLAVLYLLWRSRGTASRLAWRLGVGALLMWVMVALYVPSPDLLILGFALAGATVGLLGRPAKRAVFANRKVALASMALIAVSLCVLAFVGVRRTLSEAYVNQAVVALNAGDLDAAHAALNASLAIETTSDNLRGAVALTGAQLQQLAAEPVSDQTEQALTDALKQGVEAGQRAIVMDPQDYRSYLALAGLYDLLATNKVKGAYEQAKAAYQAAATYSPLNPTIPYLLSRLEASAGTAAGMQDALKQALTLKPDYTDAILFAAQAAIAQGDMAAAIANTLTAARTAPGVPSVWLQLGLLYYANNDPRNAAAALEQALKLEPDYANAQYYLGLSYWDLGRTQDAQALFAHLAQTNPTNTDVRSIINNLQAGLPPLGAPATTTATTTVPTKPKR